jgi:restriction system protein
MREARRPLSAKEVYHGILDKNLYRFHAQKPEYVVRGQIRRHCRDLDFPTAAPTKYFGMTRDGEFFPLETPISTKAAGPRADSRCSSGKKTTALTLRQIKELHHLHCELMKERILRDLKRLPPPAFERFAKRLLDVYGFEDTHVAMVGKDGGIDGHGKLKVGLAHMTVAFQCKRWTKSNVGRPEIDKFRGAISGEYQQGIFFTTARFSVGAKEVSFKRGAVPIVLIDGPGVVDLMIEKNFGVEQESLPVYSYALDLVISGEGKSEKM